MGAGDHQAGQHPHHHHEEQQRRHEPFQPAAVEVEQQIAQGVGRVAGQGGRDHEARDHKEHVHPQIAAGQEPFIDVVEDHRHHRQGPQAVDLGPVAAG
jgi:hypothetical protein